MKPSEHKPPHWDEDPEFTYKDWRHEVISDSTRLDYGEWVEHQRECKLDEVAAKKHPADMTYKEAFQSGPEVWMNPGSAHAIPESHPAASRLGPSIHHHPDPYGTPQDAPGAKNDAGKAMSSLLLNFSRALTAVAEVATYGANKYTRDGWEHVPEGITRYRDAEWRHLLKGQQEPFDPESGMPHAWHRAWNVLAVLELELRQQNPES